MKPSGLIRILLTSVFALLVAGGMMTAQAQPETIIVDADDPNANAQSIPAGLGMIDTDGDLLVIRASNYNEPVSLSQTTLASGESFTIEVRGDDDSGAQEVSITDFDVQGGINVTVQSDGNAFFRLAASSPDDLNLANGTLTINSSADFRLAGGAGITRTANASISGSNSPSFPNNVNVTYNVANGSFNAGRESPVDLGNGTLTVTDGGAGSGNTVTFRSARFGSFAAQALVLNAGNDVAADFRGAVSITNSITVGAAQSLSVDGGLTIEGTDNFLDADAAGNDQVDVGSLTFASIQSSNQGAGTALLRGDGNLVVDGAVTFQAESNSSGSSQTWIQEIRAENGDSNFEIGSVVETSVSDGNAVDQAVVDVFNTNGGSVTLAGGSIRDIDQSAGPGSQLQIDGDVEVDVAAGAGIDNSGPQANIEVSSGNTLTLRNVVSGSNSVTHQNSDNGSISGSGTVLFQSGNNDDQTINVTDNDPAAEDVNRLPNVTVSGGNGLTINGAHSTASEAGIQIGGSLVGNANVNLATTSGGATIGGSVTVNGGNTDITGVSATTRTTDVSLNGGTLTIDGNRLDVVRNFVRTSTNGTLSSTAGSMLAFTQSGSDGIFDTESIFTLQGTLQINKTNASLTLVEALRVSGNVNIVDQGQFLQTTFALDDNLFLTGMGQLTVDSNLDTRDNFVVFESAYTVAGDDTLGAAIVSGGSDVTVQPSASPNTNSTTLKFDDSIELRNGGITIAGGEDLSPAANTEAEIIRTLQAAPANPNDIATQANASFNGDNTLYDVTYRGSAALATASELTNFVRDLTVQPGATPQLDDNHDVNGVLTVNAGGTIADNGGTRTLNLATDSLSHSVVGTVNGANVVTLQVDGNGVTINGSTNNNNASSVQDVVVNGSGASISDVQRITGNLTLNQGGTLALGLSDAAGQGLNDATVAGNVTVSDSLSLTDDATVTSADAADDVKVNSTGRVDVGSSNLIVAGSNADFDGDTGAAYYSSGGYLVFNGANTPTFGTNGVAVPRVMVSQAINLAEDVATDEALDVDANINLNNNDFEFSGSVELAANITDGSANQNGVFRALGTTLTAEANQSIWNLEVATGSDDSLKVMTDDPTTPTPRTVSVRNQLMLTTGTLYHGINEVQVTGGNAGNVAFTSGKVVASTGFLDLNTAAGNITVTPTPNADDSLSVSNLEVSGGTANNASFGNDGLDIGVTSRLRLNAQFDGTTGDGDLLIGDGAWILRGSAFTGANVLTESPVFVDMYNARYQGGGTFTSGFEITNDPATLRNLVINNGGGSVFLDANSNRVVGDVPVYNLLNLVSGNLDYERQVVMSDSSTVRRTGNAALADAGSAADGDINPPAALQADGHYTLVYTGTAFVRASGLEFLQTGNIDLITQAGGTNPTINTTVEIPFDRTVKHLLVNNVTPNSTTRLLNTTVAPNQPSTLTVEDSTEVEGGTLASGTVVAQSNVEVQNATVFSTLDVTGNTMVTDGSLQGPIFTEGDISLTGQSVFGAASVTFDGSGNQNLGLPGNSAVGNLTLAQTNADGRPRTVLSGGNLTVNGQMTFSNGLFVTGDNRLSLSPPANTAAFTRNVVRGNASHVVGTVRQFIPNGFAGRLEYPVGTDTSATLQRPRYRPYALTFDQTDPAITATNVDVEHVNENPRGTVGLPLDGGPNVTTGNYPDFYWLVDATTSLGSQQRFDIELQGDNLGLPFEDEEDLRIIRRFDGNAQVNQWKLQGDPADYDNILTVEEGDSTVVVRDIGSQGGIVTQASRMTIGVPSRAPVFTAGPAPGDSLTVLEDSTLTADFQAEGRDIGSELAFSLQNAPDNASIQSINGLAANVNATQSGANGGFGSGSSPGSGTASFTVNQSNGTITSIDYEISITGLDFSGFVDGAPGTADADDDVQGFHIHNADRGESGGIAFGIIGSQSDALNPDTTNDADRTISVESGNEVVISGSWDTDEGDDPNNFASAILNAANGEDVPLYLNLHTTGNAGGEIRGQLTGQETARFTFTPDFEQAGVYDITAVVTDQANGLSASRAFTVEVLDNTPPFVLGSPSGDSTITAGDASLVLQFAVGSIDFSLAQRNAADVSGDGNINAADASLILQFVAGLIDEFPAADGSSAVASAKSRTSTMATVSGRVGWGELASAQKDGTMNLPVLLQNAENVRSVQLTAKFDPSTMSVSDVTSALPSGWQMVHKVDREAGTIRIAMAGAEPVSAGEIANLVIAPKEDAGADISGQFALNTAGQQSIAATTVRALPDDFALKANYPNPVQQATTIEYALPEETKVTLEVYNVLGQRVATLVNEKKTAGQHKVTFDASQLSSGMYIYRIQAGSFTKSNRMTIVK